MSADDWSKEATEAAMKGVVEILKTELAGIRIGRADPSFLSAISVDGKPIAKWGQVQVKDAATLTLTLFDQSNLGKISKGLEECELKLSPSSDGRALTIPIPRCVGGTKHHPF